MGEPVANKADAAWNELQELRVEARALGLDVDDSWPIQELRRAISAEKART